MPQYYSIDRTKLTMGELWWVSTTWMSLIAGLLVKWRVVGPHLGAPIVRPEGIRPLRFDQFPAQSRVDLQPAIDNVIAAGLTVQMYYQAVPENEFKSEDVARAVAFLTDDHRMFAVLAWERVQRSAVVLTRSVTAVRKRSDFQCISLLTTGEVLITVNRRRIFDGMAHVSAEHVVGASPAAIIALHGRRLSAVPQDQIVRGGAGGCAGQAYAKTVQRADPAGTVCASEWTFAGRGHMRRLHLQFSPLHVKGPSASSSVCADNTLSATASICASVAPRMRV
jgi:hypothetical protein